MGKGEAGLVRIVAPANEIIAHEISICLLSIIDKVDGLLLIICGKGLANPFDLHLRGRKAPVDQPSVLSFDQGLFSKAVSRDHDDVGVDVALAALPCGT